MSKKKENGFDQFVGNFDALEEQANFVLSNNHHKEKNVTFEHNSKFITYGYKNNEVQKDKFYITISENNAEDIKIKFNGGKIDTGNLQPINEQDIRKAIFNNITEQAGILQAHDNLLKLQSNIQVIQGIVQETDAKILNVQKNLEKQNRIPNTQNKAPIKQADNLKKQPNPNFKLFNFSNALTAMAIVGVTVAVAYSVPYSVPYAVKTTAYLASQPITATIVAATRTIMASITRVTGVHNVAVKAVASSITAAGLEKTAEAVYNTVSWGKKILDERTNKSQNIVRQ